MHAQVDITNLLIIYAKHAKLIVLYAHQVQFAPNAHLQHIFIKNHARLLA